MTTMVSPMRTADRLLRPPNLSPEFIAPSSSPNDPVHRPGPLDEPSTPEGFHAGRVRCSGWFGQLPFDAGLCGTGCLLAAYGVEQAVASVRDTLQRASYMPVASHISSW
jgi:hypothetical protein